MHEEGSATGLATESTALTRLRWARELLAGLQVAREEGLLSGARDAEARLVEAVDGCSQQVRAWRAWVKERHIRSRARERVLGLPRDPDVDHEFERGASLVRAALTRLDAAVHRLRFDLDRLGRPALVARLTPAVTGDQLHVDDLWDPADGSTKASDGSETRE